MLVSTDNTSDRGISCMRDKNGLGGNTVATTMYQLLLISCVARGAGKSRDLILNFKDFSNAQGWGSKFLTNRVTHLSPS